MKNTKTEIRKMSIVQIRVEILEISPNAELGRSDLYYKEDLIDLLYNLRQGSRPKMGSRMEIIYDYLLTVENREARYMDLVNNCAPFSPFGKRFGGSGRRACQGFDSTLKRMLDNGILERPSRGLYRISETRDERRWPMSY